MFFYIALYIVLTPISTTFGLRSTGNTRKYHQIDVYIYQCDKAFLLTRLKKYLNPHVNSCSKVISELTTGNILHESSSAPQQHKSVQYKWFTLYLHRDVSHTDMLQPHFISCRVVSGAGGNMRGSRNFCQFYLVLSLFYCLQRGSNGFIAEKTILILYQGSRGVHCCPGGGGVQMLIS